MLDTSRSHETPEGINLEIRIAGPIIRACAWAIDALIRGVIYIAISIAFGFLGGVGLAVIMIGIFLIEWFYPVFFELKSGATPGKKAMGLLVIHDNGTPISWPASLIRNLLRTADFLPFFYGFGLVAMLSNRDFKRLGDMAAGTLVVYQDSPPKRHQLPEIEGIRPPLELTLNERHTLMEFAERSSTLSQDRNIELADYLSEVTQLQGADGMNRLYAYAKWLAQGR